MIKSNKECKNKDFKHDKVPCVKVVLPGDKSLSHRALIFASLAKGKSIINNLLLSEDIARTISILRACGVCIYKSGINQYTVVSNGLQQPRQPLYCGNSGTTIRLMVGVLTGLGFLTKFCGDYSLSLRSMYNLVDPMLKFGIRIKLIDNCLPLRLLVDDKDMCKESIGEKSNEEMFFDLAHNSAQIKSAILLAAQIRNKRVVISQPQRNRDHTELMLKFFGAGFSFEDNNSNALKYKLIRKNKGTKGTKGKTVNKIIKTTKIAKIIPFNLDIATDTSLAMFVAVTASLIKNSVVVIDNVLCNEQRVGGFKTLQQMGADIEFFDNQIIMNENIASVKIKYSNLQGINDDGKNSASMIDEYPIIFVAACCAYGTSKFMGLEELKLKESNRLVAMAKGLARLGLQCKISENCFEIVGQKNRYEKLVIKPNQLVKSFHDHRIAMSFYILSMICQQKIAIDDIFPIATSFPGFFQAMRLLRNEIATQ